MLLCFWDNGFVTKTPPLGKGAPNRCYHATTPTGSKITFDDRRLVANAGLLLPATLARHLGLPELVQQRLDLGDAPGRANAGDKMMTLVASALAGGDCIDDADVLRTGGTACTLGGTVKAPSTLGTFLRSFRWGHVRQLDRVSRELLARAWQAGAGPGDGPLTIDLDSTICETYGLAKEGARHHGYTGKRGYHPLLAIAAGTGEVLMSRLREGRANTARGAAHFLREAVSRVRHGWGQRAQTVRADSGFYGHAQVAACRRDGCPLLHHHPPAQKPAEPDRGDSRCRLDSHSLLDGRRRRCCRDDLHPVPDQAGRRAGAAHCPAGEADARFPARSLRQIQLSRLHHRPLDGETLELEADHRRHAEVENAIRDLKYGVGLNHMPSGRFAANGAWLAVQVMAHNLARWTARIGLGEQIATTKTLRRRFFSLAGRITRSARRLTLHLPRRWPWESQFTRALARLRAIPLPA